MSDLHLCKRCGVGIKDDTSGYGRDNSGAFYCPSCAAVLDHEAMLEHGQYHLYLVETREPRALSTWRYWLLPSDFKLTNWNGLDCNYRIRTVKQGRHNIAGKRIDVWFTLPEDEYVWHGVNYGNNSQVLRCKRTKQRKDA